MAWINGLSVFQIKVGLLCYNIVTLRALCLPPSPSFSSSSSSSFFPPFFSSPFPSLFPSPSPPLSRSLLLPHTQVHNKYSAADFDDDLRTVLRRSGCKDEKIVFIMDESNVLESGFLERMNTLLANGEVS